MIDDRTILLFFKRPENDKFFKYDRYLKPLIRPIYCWLRSRQAKTGFEISFSLMCRALDRAHYKVRVNDYRTARRNPHYPVGIVGFPAILDNWPLPNPAVLGPSLYDHPMLAPDLMSDPRFRSYAVLAPWTREIYSPVCGDACFEWFAGIDLDQWPDLTEQTKKFDFLVYDKVRWHHEEYKVSLIEPLLAELNRRGLTYIILRYSKHHQRAYRRALGTAKGMIFLCEHETQGLAYQEALASGVPVLAWDRGFWADPLWKRFHASPPPASSVPFFSSTCGQKFMSVDDFPAALTSFLERRSSYKPRQFVEDHLTMQKSAEIYAREYFALLPGTLGTMLCDSGPSPVDGNDDPAQAGAGGIHGRQRQSARPGATELRRHRCQPSRCSSSEEGQHVEPCSPPPDRAD